MPRPKKVIDEAAVADMAARGASDREIADILGCDHTTVANRFSPLLRKKRAERRLRLREAQFATAEDGNPALLIWLGKQELGQSERVAVETTGAVRRQIEIPAEDEGA